MKTETNIYDIDGEIIRKAGDNHEFTLQEAQDKLKYYKGKLEAEKSAENPNQKKIAVYNDYINNLANYVAFQASKLTGEELLDLIGANNLKKTDTEDINNALNDTETDTNTENEVPESTPTGGESDTNEESGDDETVGREYSDVHEERPVSQSDLLVERDNVSDNMDEYVDYIEVNE